LPPLDQFSLVEVLGNEPDRKLAFLHIQERKEGATMVDEEGNKTPYRNQAVVILDKKPFSDEDFEVLLDPQQTKLHKLMQNDIYGGYEIELPAKNNALKGTVIYPATSKHIEKYRSVKSVIVTETSSDYEKITLPYITQSKFSTQWVENILDGKAEQDRIVYNDSDFLLAPDLKWDGKRLENLYVTAIVRQPGIKSIRDLKAEHLPLLKNIFKKASDAIFSKYKVPVSQLRVFAHYQPSYYHFHVHFVHIMYEALGTSTGKAHLLNDIIDNIEMVPDYYQKKTLYYTLKINDPLYKLFQSASESAKSE